MTAVWLALGAFLVGSFPTGVVVARARGVDLRKVGSGNIGATNVGRALGKSWGIAVLLVDALKGYAPTMVAARWPLDPYGVAAVALGAVLGHLFSIFLKGHGGKGVATSFGAALALSPLAAGASAAVYVLLYAATRISSVGSLASLASYPAALWLTGDRQPAHYLFASAVVALVVARHRENIRRLIRREELKS